MQMWRSSNPKTLPWCSGSVSSRPAVSLFPNCPRSMYEPSEVHAAVKRAQASHLLHGPVLRDRPNYSGIEEFLIHALKYAFPVVRGELTRGAPDLLCRAASECFDRSRR